MMQVRKKLSYPKYIMWLVMWAPCDAEADLHPKAPPVADHVVPM